MTEPPRFPALAAWMDGAPGAHPLREMIKALGESEDANSASASVLGAFDSVIASLEDAKPERLAGERSEFRRARTFDDLLIVRAELVAGAKLARAGIGFDFGRRGGQPEPDLLLRDVNLAIEVKARRLDGLRDLHDDLEKALAEVDAPVIVHLACGESPLYVKANQRAAIVAQTLGRVESGHWGTAVVELEQPWASTPQLRVEVRLFQQPPVPWGSRVVIEGGWELSGHLQDVESAVMQVLEDEQKIRQAEAMPTILLVDAARVGKSWIRPARVWAQRLAARLPAETPFVGVAVMIPTLDKPDAELSLALRAGAAAEHLSAARELAVSLGMTEV